MELQKNEYIHTKSRSITFAFAALWIFMAGLIALFECDVLPVGIWMEGDLGFYYQQSLGILLALVLIPASLKFFHVRLQKIKHLPWQESVRKYQLLSWARLGALLIPAVFNLLLYYFSLNTAPAFVALITMMATLFCLPGERRMRNELEIEDETPPLL